MRVIAGEYRGRRLFTPGDQRIRPTSDRLRETVFNILARRPAGCHVLDLYAGTGALGIEALSRGASSCTFVDVSKTALRLIERNLTHVGVRQPTQLIRWNIHTSLNCLKDLPSSFNLVLLDPPYGQNLIAPTLTHLTACGCLSSEAIIVLEHDIREQLPDTLPNLKRFDQRRQRKSLVSFLRYMI